MKLLLVLLLWAATAIAVPPVRVPKVGTPIPGKYIVKLSRRNFTETLKNTRKFLKKDPTHVYQTGDFAGFAADLDDDAVKQLRRQPNVDYIEQDAVAGTTLEESLNHFEKRAFVTQSSSTWGLARLSHKLTGSSSYTYDDSGGSNTCVYIIDTGIDAAHPDFEGRATFLTNLAGDNLNTDGNGHGTHCAGTIGSKTYGVSKKARLFGVKVLDSSGAGANSAVIAGLNFILTDSSTRSGCRNGFIVSMSLGGAASAAVNSAVADVTAAGIFVAVAAGNSAQDASTFSPASEPSVFTVGATNSTDGFAYFSNYGSTVDLLAPGVDVVSLWPNSSINTLSGTSMAAPHVAGLAAYILSYEGRKTRLTDRLTALSTKGAISNLPAGTRNCLAFNGNPTG
ncbi:subtilisin-like serine protease [Curvularia kusanoi]|uniref:Subtilisin-like serine protease n=1 Tax=Curvularia kusanoi TaxID=90978 RepID=A0A9P4WBS1_CURKU|nr:subtilisin-like serine protease [Curvularia kusanoi]